MKMKKYAVAHGGGERIAVMDATCITNALKHFAETIGEKCNTKRLDKESGTIRLEGSTGLCSDYVVFEID